TGWYNDEHTDTTNGNPVVRHFPVNVADLATVSPSGEVGLGAALTYAGGDADSLGRQPTTAPCATGQSLFTKDGNRWTGTIWKRLQFGLDKAHYFQYYYASSGTGGSSVYLVAGRADLDCDGTYSDYRLRGNVNAAGEVERSNIVKRDPLE
ncbi:MAG: hypothetical protein AAGJ35_14765, partial [Myxococcota bacterium]